MGLRKSIKDRSHVAYQRRSKSGKVSFVKQKGAPKWEGGKLRSEHGVHTVEEYNGRFHAAFDGMPFSSQPVHKFEHEARASAEAHLAALRAKAATAPKVPVLEAEDHALIAKGHERLATDIKAHGRYHARLTEIEKKLRVLKNPEKREPLEHEAAIFRHILYAEPKKLPAKIETIIRGTAKLHPKVWAEAVKTAKRHKEDAARELADRKSWAEQQAGRGGVNERRSRDAVSHAQHRADMSRYAHALDAYRYMHQRAHMTTGEYNAAVGREHGRPGWGGMTDTKNTYPIDKHAARVWWEMTGKDPHGGHYVEHYKQMQAADRQHAAFMSGKQPVSHKQQTLTHSTTYGKYTIHPNNRLTFNQKGTNSDVHVGKYDSIEDARDAIKEHHAKVKAAQRKVKKSFVIKGGADDSKWYAISTAIWQKVKPEKKAKYLKYQRAALRKENRKWPSHGYAKVAPKVFMHRIKTGIKPAGMKSLIVEFPESIRLIKALYYEGVEWAKALADADLRKDIHAQIEDEAKNLAVKVSNSSAAWRNASPAAKKDVHRTLMGATAKVTAAPKPPGVQGVRQAHAAASLAGKKPVHSGTKVAQEIVSSGHAMPRHQNGSTGLHALAHYAGVHPAVMHSKAVQAGSFYNFHAKLAKEHPDLVKKFHHKSIEAAYRSVMANSTKERDMKKALGAVNDLSKSLGNASTVLGHTSTGKPVKVRGDYHKNFTSEEHDEASEIHSDLANRLESAASRWGQGGYGNGKLPAASRKALEAHAKHHRDQSRAHMDACYKKRREEAPKTDAPVASEAKFASTGDSDLKKGDDAMSWKPVPGKMAGGFSEVHHAQTSHGMYAVGKKGGKFEAHYMSNFKPGAKGNQRQKIGAFKTHNAAKDAALEHHNNTSMHPAAVQYRKAKKSLDTAALAKALNGMIETATAAIVAGRKERCRACSGGAQKSVSFTGAVNDTGTSLQTCICDKPIAKSAVALRVTDQIEKSDLDIIRVAKEIGVPLSSDDIEKFIEDVNAEE